MIHHYNVADQKIIKHCEEIKRLKSELVTLQQQVNLCTEEILDLRTENARLLSDSQKVAHTNQVLQKKIDKSSLSARAEKKRLKKMSIQEFVPHIIPSMLEKYMG